jgi:hypothetical protein
MGFKLDAWLERKTPLIRVINADTGEEVYRLDAVQIRNLMDSGDLWEGDLRNVAGITDELPSFLKGAQTETRDPTSLRLPVYCSTAKG